MLQKNMLQTDGTRTPLSGEALSDQAEGDGIGELVNFSLGFLRRQFVVIGLTAALAVAASLVYLLITPPTYTAQVQILLAGPPAHCIPPPARFPRPAGALSQI